MDSLISVSGTPGLERQSINASSKNLNGFVLVIGRNGILRYVSATVEKHLDFTSSEMVGEPIFDFLASDDHPAMNTALTCLNNNYPVIFPRVFECWMCCKGHQTNFYYRRVIMHVTALKRSEPIEDSSVGLACLARASKLSLSPQPRSSFGFGRFTTLISFPQTTVQQINAIEIDSPCRVDISVGDNYMDYVHELDQQELKQYFNLVSLAGGSLPLTISSFYRIQIDSSSNDGQRLALVQTSSRFISRDSTQNTIILSTHTIIRLVDRYESSSAENAAMENANICSIVERSVNESSSVVASPGTNESSKENNQLSPAMYKPTSVDNQLVQTQVRTSSESCGRKSPSETVLRRSRSHRLLQLLTCGRTESNDDIKTNNQLCNKPINSSTLLDLTTLESACGLVLTHSYYDQQPAIPQQKTRKRSQQQNKKSLNDNKTRANQLVKTKKGRKPQIANLSAPSTQQNSWIASNGSFDFAQKLMGIEETTATLSRTLFDQEKDCSGILSDEELSAIREDPEEREQMIRFVLEASASCTRPISDDFLDMVKSELVKVFHEVSLSPSWHRRESVWMNHALQLAKLHYNRLMDEQRILMQQRAYCKMVGADPRLSPYEMCQDPNEMRLHQQQQLWMMQRRTMECSTPFVEYEAPVRPVEYVYASNGQRCPLVVTRQFNQPVNEYVYQPRQMMAGDPWQRQCVPVDRRRLYCDSNGMMPVPVFPVRTRDSRLMLDNAQLTGLTNRTPDGLYAQYNSMPASSAYSPSTPMRINSDCPDQLSDQRYRLVDSGGYSSFAGGALQEPNEFARYRQMQSGEILQSASPVQIMPAGGHSVME